MRGSIPRLLPANRPSSQLRGQTLLLQSFVLLCCASGCGGNSTKAPAAVKPAPQKYFAPAVAGTTEGGAPHSDTGIALTIPQAYTIDDIGATFSQTTYQSLPSQLLNAGVTSSANRGLLALGITINYAAPTFAPVTYPSPQTGSFALELSGQAGGLIQMLGQPVAPLAAATACPSTTTQTYQFITIPSATWNAATDTAYGTVDVSGNGSAVSLKNIHQSTLPSAGGTGTPAQPAPATATGSCGPTVYGNVTNIPGQPVVDNQNPQVAPAQADIAIGPTGLLVEDNASGAKAGPIDTLGAGTGAVGLPKPSGSLTTSSIVGAQYLGFIYSPGPPTSTAPTAWSSHLASFGFAAAPSSCASVAASTSTLIYGGDFTNDDPSTSPDGFGNCDYAVDLGTQDASTNGLYSNATVWVGAAYAGNPTPGTMYSFPAVAIAGQLNGKYAVFVIGQDATQPWTIYLVQSN